jgi:AraC-like DNA-binding protein
LIVNQQKHLTLRLARLKRSEVLEQSEEGLNFLFSKAGAGRFTSKLATHRLSPGDILVFDGAAGYKLDVFNTNSEFLFWAFSVCFENLLPLFDSSEISFLHNVTEGFKTAKFYASGSPLATECHRLLEVVPPQYDLDHRGQLVRIAATILSGEFNGAQSQRSGYVRTEDHMVQVIEKLSASELINLSVGELADRFSCSRRHLNRLFHKHFRVSVSALRMEMRLLKAISLLRDANIKIINVAEQCGFNHLGLFNTCFKRRFGTNPGQWRKSTIQAASASARTFDKKLACPLQSTGLCPMGGEIKGSSPEVMTTFAGKITDGASILEDLKRRDLVFGSQALSNIKRNLPDTRTGE